MRKRNLITLRELAAKVPPDGVHWMTIYRWTTKGISPGGKLTKLRSQRVGSKLYTTWDWFREFLAAQQIDSQTRDELLQPIADRTERELEKELAS